MWLQRFDDLINLSQFKRLFLDKGQTTTRLQGDNGSSAYVLLASYENYEDAREAMTKLLVQLNRRPKP